MVSLFELRGVSKSYGAAQALQPTDLSIGAGQTTVLLGQSGSGKSTILRLLVGLVRPDRGKVLFEGNPLLRETLQTSRRAMGYVIQEGGLFPHLTARENVELLPRHVGWNKDRRQGRMQELSDLVRLRQEVWNRYPQQLSGGQRQRVALVRALMMDPHVLLLDEPLGALDPVIRRELQDELADIFLQLGKSVVLVTHDVAEAAHFGEQLVLLHQGRVLQQGRLADLQLRPADPWVTRFLEAPRSVPSPTGGEGR